MKAVLLIATLFFSPLTFAQLSQDYAQLMMLDLEEMNSMVQQRIRTSRADNSLQPLVDAMIILMSRPDEDGNIRKIWPSLHGELRSRKVYDKVVLAAVDTAIQGAKDDDLSAAKQATYYITLTNMIANFGGYAKTNEASKQAIEKIRDADIEVTSSVRRERKMRVMRETVSPSKLAEAKLKQLFPPKSEDDDED